MYYVGRQLAMKSPHDTNIFKYFSSDLIYIWSLKVRFSSRVTHGNFIVETFVRIE